jgi:hypothetical protein
MPYLIALCAMGCGAEGPPATPAPTLYAVTGKVLNSEGEPYPGGMIQLISVENAEWTTMGQIKEDGSFTLQTMHDGRMVDGAIAGEHSVTIIPLMGDQTQTDVPEPIVLKESVSVDATESNSLEVRLP